MASLKWDFTNWVTVVLMVGIAWVVAGLVKSVITGGMSGSAS